MGVRPLRLCAGRVGQLVNLSSLGADAGVSHVTARQWLTLLEASYVVFLLPPFFANIRKRLVRSPKVYFHDVGLACHLLGIEHAGQLATHPLRGPLFENMVVAEALKHRFNRGRTANLFFFRDSRGLECDLLYPTGDGLAAIEIKSGATINSDFFSSLGRVADLVSDVSVRAVVHGGGQRQSRSAGEALPLGDFPGFLEGYEAGSRRSWSVQSQVQRSQGRVRSAGTTGAWSYGVPSLGAHRGPSGGLGGSLPGGPSRRSRAVGRRSWVDPRRAEDTEVPGRTGPPLGDRNGSD